MDNIRLAIVGCGRAPQYDYLPALKRMGWRPVCFVDEDLSRAKEIAKGSSACVAVDLDSVIDDFDAAIVTSMLRDRHNVCLKLADAGKYLLVPPPLSMTPEQALSVFGKARATITTASPLRFARAARWIKSLLNDQHLGQITGFEVRAGNPFTRYRERGALADNDEEGGGVFADFGPELADLLSWWLRPLSVDSFADDGLGGAEAEALASLRTSQGVPGTVELSRSRPLRNSIVVRGEVGLIEFDLVKLIQRAEPTSILDQRYNNQSGHQSNDRSKSHVYTEQLRHWRLAIGGGSDNESEEVGALQTISLLNDCRQKRKALSQVWLTPASNQSTDPVPAHSNLAGRRVLVTGASGFIGTRLVEKLVQDHGAHVTALVRNPSHAARLARLDVQLRQGDLNNSTDLDEVLPEQDVVLNLAHDFKRTARENVSAFANLTNASIVSGVGQFIQVSSIVVYDDWPNGNITEKSPTEKPGSDYKNAKLEMERELLDRAALACAIVQPTIVYGPYSWMWTDRVVDQLASGTVVLPGEGQGLCHAVYVDDVADAIILAALAEGAGGERYIVSGNEPTTWRTFHEAYERALNVNSLKYIDANALSGESQGGGKLKSLIANPLQLANWGPVRHVLNTIEQTMGEETIEKLRAQVIALRGRGGRPVYRGGSGNLHS